MIDQNDINLLDYISGELREDEREEVLKWIESSIENRVYFEQFRQNYLSMRWGTRSSLVKGEFPQIKQRLQRHKIMRYIARCAVAVVILSVGGLGVHSLRQEREITTVQQPISSISPGSSRAYLQLSSGEIVPVSTEEKILKEKGGTSITISSAGEVLYHVRDSLVEVADEVFNKLIVPRGGEFVVTLDDGTRVWLNSGTEFRYPTNFVTEQREVYLKGEAYFDVKRDTTRPFVVIVNDCAVKVYGTQFNINTHKEGVIQTVLVSGSVAFRKGDEEFRLQPGEKAEYWKHEGKVEVNQVDVSSYIAWKDGTFIFENESLEDIMNTLSRWYDVDVFYTSPEAKRVYLTGKMKRYKDIQELLYFFERISDVKFTIKGKVITVSEK